MSLGRHFRRRRHRHVFLANVVDHDDDVRAFFAVAQTFLPLRRRRGTFATLSRSPSPIPRKFDAYLYPGKVVVVVAENREYDVLATTVDHLREILC